MHMCIAGLSELLPTCRTVKAMFHRQRFLKVGNNVFGGRSKKSNLILYSMLWVNTGSLFFKKNFFWNTSG